MLGLSNLTNKTNIGFYSESYSSLIGTDLIDVIEQKNSNALDYFGDLLWN